MTADINPYEPPKAPLDAVAAESAPELWNPDAAGAWSLFFSPIFGSILVRKNWQALGDEAKARTGMVWIIVSIVMLVATMLTVPFLGMIYIIVWYVAWQRPQKLYIRERWGRDYPRKGWLVPLLLGVVVYIGAILAVAVVLVALSSPASAAWTPPPDPDPGAILREAKQDTDAAMTAFLKEWPDEVPKGMIEAARRGVVPDPWP